MSEVKKSRMKPRLGQLMAEKGGMYVAEALKRADATLEVLREPSLSGIDDYITALDNLLIAEIDEAVRIEKLYARAGDIVSLSGAERSESVQIAARSLCELLDEAENLASVLAGVQVHIASIKLLHRAPDNPTLHEPILQGLASVLEKRRAATAPGAD
ncbi:hypothetical protein [Caulobacter soli]|uniref:hypothetical protein n=1 Tax=Caulobacter soli TaxID=2708539 RepID=UPI0013EA951A|nr:hypothetical protein [Caulobacter soli]